MDWVNDQVMETWIVQYVQQGIETWILISNEILIWTSNDFCHWKNHYYHYHYYHCLEQKKKEEVQKVQVRWMHLLEWTLLELVTANLYMIYISQPHRK